MIILRYAILASILWTLPSFVLAYISPGLGSMLSHLTMALLVGYFALVKEKGPVLWVFVLLGILYYFIAGLQFTGIPDRDYVMLIIKYLIIIVAGTEVLRKSSIQELYVVLIFGALSIIIHAVLFPLYNANFSPNYGRYSGFYLNPNSAGAICLAGLSLNFGIKNKYLKYIGFLLFAVGGFFTFSRYFLAMFLVINMALVVINKKNLIAPIVAVLGLIILFTFSTNLNVNVERFNALKSIFSDDVDTETLQEDSRTETWKSYNDVIGERPVLGHGYGKLQGGHFGLHVGVHNTYLMVIGESGIIPFSILVGMMGFFLIKGFSSFKTHPQFAILALVMSTALLVSHTYFDKYNLLFITMYLFIALTEVVPEYETEETERYPFLLKHS